MNRITQLEDAKVGDVFLRPNRREINDYYKVKVERITPKQVVIGGMSYWKHNAKRVGHDVWSNDGGLEEFDEAVYLESKKARILKSKRAKLSKFDWWELEAEKINHIWSILNEGDNGNGDK